MLKKQVPVYLLLIITLACSVVIFFITKTFDIYGGVSSTNIAEENAYKITRLNGYSFIKPLISAKPVNESAKYAGIKETAERVIQNSKDDGTLESASVYVRDFEKSDWFCINQEEKYMPGSLLKVPELITFLKMEEQNPGTLDRQLTFSHPFAADKKANILSKSIELGHSYTIRELLKYMIEYSDNNATYLLNQNINVATFQKVFVDLGLDCPDWNASTFYVSSKNYSVFMEALFNASYLTIKNSEYAVSLLTKSDFEDGIRKGIPVNNLRIAHKFGESGTNINKQLHESAIFYINNEPYLITVMTKGNRNVDFPRLAKVIQEVAGSIYGQLAALNPGTQKSL
jgi:beta-lactamase class A